MERSRQVAAGDIVGDIEHIAEDIVVDMIGRPFVVVEASSVAFVVADRAVVAVDTERCFAWADF